jgi:hypothetical protein
MAVAFDNGLMRRAVGSEFETSTARAPMLDIAYIGGTVAFFVLMLRYVSACEQLGSRTGEEESP